MWSEATWSFETSDKYTISHMPTAKSIMPDGMSFPTVEKALEFADSLGFLTWDSTLEDAQELETIEKTIRAKYESVAHGEDLPVERRFVVRREERRFLVIDSETDETMEEFTHRGRAASAAMDLNRGEHLGTGQRPPAGPDQEVQERGQQTTDSGPHVQRREGLAGGERDHSDRGPGSEVHVERDGL